MRWIDSAEPLGYWGIRSTRPQGLPSLAGLVGVRAGQGWVVVRPETGGWVELDDAEHSWVRSLPSGGVSDLPAAVLDVLWQRAVLAVDGRTSCGDRSLKAEVENRRDVFVLVLLLNEGCNLVCSYCYLGHASPARAVAMPNDVAEAAIVDAFDRPYAEVLIDFGEVAVAERQFRHLAGFARRQSEARGKQLAMSVQTNGTTLSEDLADFLAEYGIAAGISVDGPAAIHDDMRVFRSGAGTHALARTAVQRCTSRGVSVHIPVTIGRHNVDHPTEVLEEIADLRPGSHLLKPILRMGEAGNGWASTGVSVREYAQFMSTAIDVAARRDLDLLDTTTTKFLRRFAGDRRGWGDGCTSRYCGSGRTLQVVDRHGARHACPRFVSGGPVAEGLTIGRRARGSADDLLSPSLRTPPPTCEGCPWLGSCGGGCTLAARDDGGVVPLPDPHCLAHDAVHLAIVGSVLPGLLAGNYHHARPAAGLTPQAASLR